MMFELQLLKWLLSRNKFKCPNYGQPLVTNIKDLR